MTDERAMPTVPLRDVQPLATGLVGTGVLVIGAVVSGALSAAGHESRIFDYRYAIILVLMFLAMAAYELGIVHVHRRNFDFTDPRPIGAPERRRILRRFGALCVSLLLALASYVVLQEYALDLGGSWLLQFSSSWYAPFFKYFLVMCGVLPLLALPYFYLGERYGRWSNDEDELLAAWAGYVALAGLQRPAPGFWAAQRAFLVKFFFLPIMTVFLVGNAWGFEAGIRVALLYPNQSLMDTGFLARLYDIAYEGMYLLDVAIAVIGYSCTLRIFDTHIRWADPTLLGWGVALACYPPFARVLDVYISYNEGGQYWSDSFSGTPVVLLLVGAVILALSAIYAMATVAFGLRFSNVTNRGILSRGPYAYVRHPAYVAKNLVWWLLSVPFLHSPGACLRLLAWNGLYFARAITEEQHLKKDPHYREYMEKVKYRFIPGVI